MKLAGTLHRGKERVVGADLSFGSLNILLIFI